MPVYLDHAATTPMLPVARDAYIAALDLVGNPSSIHSQGRSSQRRLEESREIIAASLGADPVEVVLTSGGTESINLGVKGLYWARQAEATRPVVLVPGGEHHATVDAVEWLERHEGARVEWLPVDEVGRLHPETLDAALAAHGASVALVSVLWANNEVGTVQPVAELVEVAERFGVPVHIDAVAAYGYLPIDFHAVGAAALSVSAHKIGGPAGVGALLLARRSSLEPLIHGGNQQRVRSGTQDAAGAVAFAAAAASVPRPASAASDPSASDDDDQTTVDTAAFLTGLARLRDRLVAGVRSAVPEAVLRGDPAPQGRLPGNAHFTFPGCEGDSLLFLLDMAGFSVSTGSACQAGVPEVSHVLLAMGVPADDARGALRFTLGHGTTEGEIDALIEALPGACAAARRAGYSDRVVSGRTAPPV
ncbi:cysteine desulfurase [Herbiconiux moechotypicola]|uniref:Cysteine desulfurase family protein n=1 Tax=Herbiconiux moechotypicola TaxID=637393 RepID=A0ABP5QGB1_9MICO|nr:cysteine desulfurase family protein [Herbiconiux moechotypicola]MCS5729776.1 cysteine desulfurase [Herbiconiux moechotypicola]